MPLTVTTALINVKLPDADRPMSGASPARAPQGTLLALILWTDHNAMVRTSHISDECRIRHDPPGAWPSDLSGAIVAPCRASGCSTASGRRRARQTGATR